MDAHRPPPSCPGSVRHPRATHTASSPLHHPRGAAATTLEVQPLFPSSHAFPPTQVICHLGDARQINAHPECTAFRGRGQGSPTPLRVCASVCVRARPKGCGWWPGARRGRVGNSRGRPEAGAAGGGCPGGSGVAGGGRRGPGEGPAKAGPGR